MLRTSRLLATLALLPAALVVNACVASVEDPAPEERTEAEAQDDLRARSGVDRELRFFHIEGDVGDAARRETWWLISTPSAWREVFKSAPPPEVDFAREWIYFRSAGEKPTGGYALRVTSIRFTRWGDLQVSTELETPGAGCIVTQALTRPYVLVSFMRPDIRPRAVTYPHETVAQDCLGPNPCAAVLCPVNTNCLVDEDGEARCVPLCDSDADCRAEADYCTGCDCRALGPGEQVPECSGPGVRCFADPCLNRTAVCRDRMCTLE